MKSCFEFRNARDARDARDARIESVDNNTDQHLAVSWLGGTNRLKSKKAPAMSAPNDEAQSVIASLGTSLDGPPYLPCPSPVTSDAAAARGFASDITGSLDPEGVGGKEPEYVNGTSTDDRRAKSLVLTRIEKRDQQKKKDMMMPAKMPSAVPMTGDPVNLLPRLPAADLEEGGDSAPRGFAGHGENQCYPQLDALLSSPTSSTRGFSRKRSFSFELKHSDLFSTPAEARKVPHFISSYKQVFIFQVVPLGIIFWLYIHVAANANIGSVDAGAEAYRFVVFTFVLFATFFVREELIDKRDILLSEEYPVHMGTFGYVFYGTPSKEKTVITANDFGNLITGKLDQHLCWNLRGSLGPLCFSLIQVTYIAVADVKRFQAETENGNTEGRDYWVPYCIVHGIYLLLAAMIFFEITLRSTIIPFSLMCLQVGYGAGSRVGLWNHGDLAVNEMLRIAMHFSLLLSVCGFFFMLLIMHNKKYYELTTAALVFYTVMTVSFIASVMVVPVVPIVLVLRKKKEEVLADVLVLLERANYVMLQKFRNGEDVSDSKNQLDLVNSYHKTVLAVPTVPGSLEFVQAGFFALSTTLFPIFITFMMNW